MPRRCADRSACATCRGAIARLWIALPHLCAASTPTSRRCSCTCMRSSPTSATRQPTPPRVLSTLTLVGAAGAPLFGWFAERTSARLGLLVVVVGLAASSLVLWNGHGAARVHAMGGALRTGEQRRRRPADPRPRRALRRGTDRSPDGRRDGRLHDRDDGRQHVRGTGVRSPPRLSAGVGDVLGSDGAHPPADPVALARGRTDGTHRRHRARRGRHQTRHDRSAPCGPRRWPWPSCFAPGLASADCPDCDGDGVVAINELITGIGIALGGTPLRPARLRSRCRRSRGDRRVRGRHRRRPRRLHAAATPSPTPSPTPLGPPPTEPAALLTWLQAGGYARLGGRIGAAPVGRPARRPGPHLPQSRDLRLAQRRRRATPRRRRGGEGALLQRRRGARLGGDGEAPGRQRFRGRGWYWYEGFGSGRRWRESASASAPAATPLAATSSASPSRSSRRLRRAAPGREARDSSVYSRRLIRPDAESPTCKTRKAGSNSWGVVLPDDAAPFVGSS